MIHQIVVTGVIIIFSSSIVNSILSPAFKPSSFTGIQVTEDGLVAVDNLGRTSCEGIFASSDVVTGAKTVVEAVKVLRIVADAMDQYVNEKSR